MVQVWCARRLSLSGIRECTPVEVIVQDDVAGQVRPSSGHFDRRHTEELSLGFEERAAEDSVQDGYLSSELLPRCPDL